MLDPRLTGGDIPVGLPPPRFGLPRAPGRLIDLRMTGIF